MYLRIPHNGDSLLKHVQGSNLIYDMYVEIKCQLDATEVFIADLSACSTCFGHHYVQHQELKSILQWLLPVVSGAVVFKLLVWCGAEGCVRFAGCCFTGSNHCIILLSS